MKQNVVSIPFRTRTNESGLEGHQCLSDRMRQMIVGQDDALEAILPYVDLFDAGLSPEGRPAGASASRADRHWQDAHRGGARRSPPRLRAKRPARRLRWFQLDHEVAKLIGAPPGYLGHRETQPMLTQQKLNSVTSQHSDLSLVLLDEVEKAAPSMARLLLGVLDKASLSSAITPR